MVLHAFPDHEVTYHSLPEPQVVLSEKLLALLFWP